MKERGNASAKTVVKYVQLHQQMCGDWYETPKWLLRRREPGTLTHICHTSVTQVNRSP